MITEDIKRVHRALPFIHRMNEAAILEVLQITDELIHKLKVRMDKKSSKSCATWVNKALDPKTGSAAAHRFATGKAKAPPLPEELCTDTGEPILEPAKKLAHHATTWDTQWGYRKDELHKLREQMKQLCITAKCLESDSIDGAETKLVSNRIYIF